MQVIQLLISLPCDNYNIILNCFTFIFSYFCYFMFIFCHFISAISLHVLQTETQTKLLKSNYLCKILE